MFQVKTHFARLWLKYNLEQIVDLSFRSIIPVCLLSENHRGMRFMNCMSHQVDAEVFNPRCLSISVGWLNQQVTIPFHVYFLCAKAEYIPLLYSRLLFACSAQKPQSKQTLKGGLTGHGVALAAAKNVGCVYKSPWWRHQMEALSV